MNHVRWTSETCFVLIGRLGAIPTQATEFHGASHQFCLSHHETSSVTDRPTELRCSMSGVRPSAFPIQPCAPKQQASEAGASRGWEAKVLGVK